MVLFATRVSAPRCAPNIVSRSGAPKDFAARSTLPKISRHRSIDSTGDTAASCSALSGICGSDLHIVKPRRTSSMASPDHLLRLALAAIWDAPQHPMIAIGDGLTRIPELGGDATISWIFQHTAALAVANFPRYFAPKLKIVALVVNRPATIGLHVNSVAHPAQHFVERLLARQEAHVGHADQRQP